MPGMRSEPVMTSKAAAQPGASRAGQIAVVTGGPAGLGLATATALAQPGTDVVLASLPAARCVRAAARLSVGTDDDPQVRHFLAAGIRGRPPGRARRGRPAARRPTARYLAGVILPAGGGWTAR